MFLKSSVQGLREPCAHGINNLSFSNLRGWFSALVGASLMAEAQINPGQVATSVFLSATVDFLSAGVSFSMYKGTLNLS